MFAVGSICSGVGGLDIAAEAFYDARTVWHAEIDKAASKVLARLWPGVPNLGDIAAVDWAEVAPVDVLCAGFPCQPASVAAITRAKGLADARWLWHHVAAAVGALRPRRLVVENVPGLLTVSGGWAFAQVLGALADLGYDARWDLLRASDAGAPHLRRRLFLVAWPAGEVAADADASRDRPLGRPVLGFPAPHEVRRRHHAPVGRDPGARRWGAYQPAVDRWARLTGVPAPPPRLVGTTPDAAIYEWVMGYEPGSVTAHATNAQAVGLCGNGVVPAQAVLALRLLDPSGGVLSAG